MLQTSFRRFLCVPVLLGLALPAYGGFTLLPEELFAPEFRSDRATAAAVAQTSVVPRETIMSYGREIRLVGVPFLPDEKGSIDFTKELESAQWSSATEYLLALWFDADDDRPLEVASNNELQLADSTRSSSSR